MFYKSLIIFLLHLLRETTPENEILFEALKIVHYKNVTQTSCGLKQSSTKPAIPHSCFEWHKTIEEEKSALKTIMYGRNAENGEFPYTVLIQLSGVFSGAVCTGAVINELWIISAAHCFIDWKERHLKIYPGITNYKEKSNGYYRADKIIRYEKYDQKKPNERMFDIALIKLKTKIDFARNRKVNSVCLPNRNYTHFTSLATLTGWGFVNEDEQNNNILKVTPIIIDETLDSNPHIIQSSEIIYGKACVADSGAPLVQYVDNRAVLIGTHTGSDGKVKGERCGKDLQTMYFTFIPYYIDWIRNKILNN